MKGSRSDKQKIQEKLCDRRLIKGYKRWANLGSEMGLCTGQEKLKPDVSSTMTQCEIRIGCKDRKVWRSIMIGVGVNQL